MKIRFRNSLFSILLAATAAGPAIHMTQPAAAKGGAVLNLGPFTSGEYPFINVMMSAGGFASSAGFAFPAILDENGYPVTASLPQDVGGVAAIPGEFTDASTHWVLQWSGSLGSSTHPGLQLILSNGVTEIGSSGCVSGSTAYNLSVFGKNCRIEFVFNGKHPHGLLAFKFMAGAAFDGSLANLALYRKSHQAAFAAGAIFNPDFLAAVQVFGPRVIRTLNWSLANNSNLANAAQQTPAGALGFGPRWDKKIFLPHPATGTNAYAGTLAGVSALTDGLTVQLQFANANTGPATFDLNGLGAVTVANLAAAPITYANTITAGSLWTLVYDASLHKWLANKGGLNAGVPLSIQIALANTLNADLWINIPTHATDALVSEIAATLRDGLKPTLNGWYEYSNEIWNFNDYSFPQTNFAVARGTALGFPAANAEHFMGFYALRVRQMMGNITAVYGTKKNYRRVLAGQAVGDISTTRRWRMEGEDLNGATFPLYCAAVGGTPSGATCKGDPKYNTFPNRPIDYTDVISYATYYSGAQLRNFSVSYADIHVTEGPIGGAQGLLAAADAYAAGGNGNVTKALSWVDWDLRHGTRAASAGPATLVAFNSQKNIGLGPVGVYPTWEATAAQYDSNRPPGASKLAVANYEGGMEAIAPAAAQCTAWGISTSYCDPGGKIDQLLTAYKKSVMFQQLVSDQFYQFLAQPHSLYTAWYELANSDQWSLYQGDLYSQPFMSLAAFKVLKN